ncbi:Transcriptional regulator, MerR family [Methylocella tundrae]|uniref:Transcriptional regulator, MerR family n=1 Tax=Methylocella tundrae TaxID=227605 RepID=A0A8B6M9B9_METTU|nr:MerR family transcriptional regulator [Methylocella tundrae]VTZ22483.1 Transcriptional regulator, MerR family [Methylocella tundrae]VTZ51452.1 Transcriptional regulator, MerR family [Methylocella tundrae]
MDKSADAFRTISEVAEELDLPQHVLRFWETRFPQIKPMKRAGGRRFYRPNDIDILRAIRRLLYSEGYTIKGVQRILKEQGARAVIGAGLAAADAGVHAASPAAPQARAARGDDLFSRPADPAVLDEDSNYTVPEGLAAMSDQAAAHTGAETGGRAGALNTEAIGRLKSILRELDECERMLDAARRR